MLGVAYAASIGGMATVIGSPPNLVVAGAIREMAGSSVSFVQWMAIGVPVAIILLPLTWLTLVYVTFPVRGQIAGAADGVLRSRLDALGPIRGGEARVLVIFLGTALAWFFRERKAFGGFTVPGLVDLVPGLSDAAIAVTAAMLLFIVSGTTRDGIRRPLLTWTEARTIPWDVLLFFGGGLTLAQQIEAHGITTWMATWLGGLRGLPPFVLYLGLAVTVLALSELASNLAVAAMMMPITVALGQSIGHSPVLLMLVTGLAASTGFMLPVATPPNTIVFGSGLISVRQMARAGILVDIIGVMLIVVVITLLAPLVF
jgi:sodium-dependent dicarboxylate transporter 2/3/5